MKLVCSCLLAFASLPSTNVFAQEPDPVAEEMERWRQEQKRHLARLFEIEFKREGSPRISDELLAEHPGDTLEVLVPYQQDSSSSIRSLVYAFVRRTGLSSRDIKIRREVVLRLVNGCGDPDSLVWQHAARWLLLFDESDFTRETRDVLLGIVVREPIRQEVVRVVGVANMPEMLTWLERHSDKSWSALLARARIGDEKAAREVVERAEARAAKNPAARKDEYFDDLAFTRHELALEYIARFLDSNEGEKTREETGDYGASPYKQVALDVLAKHFRDCPVKKRPWRNYTDAEFAQAHEWVRRRLVQERE